jgi:hypothetical protein
MVHAKDDRVEGEWRPPRGGRAGGGATRHVTKAERLSAFLNQNLSLQIDPKLLINFKKKIQVPDSNPSLTEKNINLKDLN